VIVADFSSARSSRLLMLLLLSLFALSFATPTQYAPIPERARPVCQNCSTVGYDIVQTGEGVYAFTDGGYWSMAVLNRVLDSHQGLYQLQNLKGQSTQPSRTLTIVDAFEGPAYLSAVKALLSLTGASTVQYLIYSHFHTDHIGNAGALKQAYPNVRIIAHDECKKSLERVSHVARPLPHETFTNKLYKIAEAGLELRYAGPGHTYGDIIIYHPQSQTLMYVDVIFPRWTPFWNVAIAADIPGVYDNHKRILDYTFKTFIGGHLTRLGDRADVEESYKYLLDVKATAERILPTATFAQIGGSLGVFDPKNNNYGNFWAAFKQLLDISASQCEKEVLSRWQGILGGVDVWTYSHCWALAESLRVDF